MNTPYENNGHPDGSTEGPEEMTREDLLKLIEETMSAHDGAATRVEAFPNQGWLRINITGKCPARRQNRAGAYKTGPAFQSVHRHVSMDRETMERIAIITHSPEMERIFVGSNPFRAEVIRQKVKVDDSINPPVNTILTISTPRIETKRFDKVAPCHLCGTKEERRRRVEEDKQRPIPIAKVETGFPQDRIDHTIDPTVLNSVRTQRDSLSAMLAEIDMEDDRSMRKSEAMNRDTTPVLEQPRIKAKLRELEHEIRRNPIRDRDHGEDTIHLLFRNRARETQILREIFEILLESMMHSRHITSNHRSISETHMCVTITRELKPLILKIASITGSREKAEKRIEIMQAREATKKTTRRTSLILFRSRHSPPTEPEDVMNSAVIELI